MAYKSSIDFNTKRINKWADIGDMPDDEARAEAMDQWEEFYGQRWSARMWLNLYSVNQSYGGPEEGGWWYDVYALHACVPVRSRDEAIAALAMLDRAGVEEFGDSREYYSAAGGEDGTIIFENRRAGSETTERPSYC